MRITSKGLIAAAKGFIAFIVATAFLAVLIWLAWLRGKGLSLGDAVHIATPMTGGIWGSFEKGRRSDRKVRASGKEWGRSFVVYSVGTVFLAGLFWLFWLRGKSLSFGDSVVVTAPMMGLVWGAFEMGRRFGGRTWFLDKWVGKGV